MFQGLLIFIHVIVSIALIMIVLLQTGKGADMGAAFGGGGSQTLFGATGASTFLSKATTAAAIIFMLTSLLLAYASGKEKNSLQIETPKAAVEEKTFDKNVSDPAAGGDVAPQQEDSAVKSDTEATSSAPSPSRTTEEGQSSETESTPSQTP